MRRSGAHSRPSRRWRCRLIAPIAVILIVGLATIGWASAEHVRTRRLARRSGSEAPGIARETSITAGPTTTATKESSTTTTAAPETTTTIVRKPVLDAAAVEAALAGRPGTVTAAVYDATTGLTYSFDPTAAPQDTASIVKVDILATLLQQAQIAGRPLTSSEQELATDMIEHSDNDAATALWDEVGAAAGLSAFDEQLGMTTTTPGPEGYWGLTTTSPLDQIKLLQAVAYPDPLLTTASRSYVISLMTQVESDQAWGVSAGVPTGVTVAVKNGWLDVEDGWQINSLGYIDGDGHDYLIAVLTTGSPTEAYGIETVEDLSRLVWTELGS